MTAGDDERLAYAYLSKVVQGPCAPLLELVAAVGVSEAARAVREWDLPPALRTRTEARRHIDTAAEDLQLIDRLGGRLITPADPEWPDWRMVAFGAASASDRDCVAPLALWVRGRSDLSALTERAVALVGTRAPSSYGIAVTTDMSAELASHRWTVVSGAAFGIDGAAHRAALSVDGATIAVLACGIDKPYPASHSPLIDEIARTGLVVSEYAPGTGVTRYQFLARNRLVAAFADAVVVVEAGWRSGARNTAKWARRLGRPALAVPGPVTSTTSTGCHQMVRDGEARLVTRASEVVDEAGPLQLPVDRNARSDRATDSLQGDRLLVYEALPAIGSRSPRELSEVSGVSMNAVRAALPMLELAGFVGADESGWFRRAKR